MATTPEIKTRFTIDGMRQAATGLRAFGRTIADTLGDARRRGGKVFDPLDRGLKGVENRAKSASKAILAIGGKGAFKGIQTGALGASIAVGGLTAKMSALSAAALKAAKESAASLKSISIDAQRIGGSTSDVAVLGYAADITGTDRDELITQISTLSNEFLTLRDNIEKSYDGYSDFLHLQKSQAKLAYQLAGNAGFNQVVSGFADQNLEAMKLSLIDAEDRIAQLDAEANRIGIRPTVVMPGDGVKKSARRLSAQYERQQLMEAVEAFKASQSPQAQALFELEQYGIDLDRASRGGVDGLLEISDAFQHIQDPSQRARVAMRLFGEDAGVKLIPLLNGGRKAIDEYRRTLEESGAIATKEDIAIAEEYTRAVQNLKTATSGVQMTIGRALTPDLTKASRELTAWLIKSREEIAKAAVEAFNDTRVFAEDAASLFGGQTDDIKTPWLDTVVQKTISLRAIWADVRKQVGLLWEGKDSDYAWVNKIRDGFIEIKKFAMDAWAVVSGGNAVDFKWLNTARDYVVAFAKRFSEAFEMLQGLVKSLGDFFKPVLDYLGTDVATLGLFLGLTRMVGLFGILTTGAGLLFKALGSVFSLAGAAAGAVGAVGGAAGGAAGATGAAAATAGGLRVALAGVGVAIGGVTSAAIVLGTTLAGAFALGQLAAKKMTEGTRGAYEELWKQQAALIKANDEVYVKGILNRRDEASRGTRDRLWLNQGIAQGGWQGRSAAEQAAYGRKQMEDFFGFKGDSEASEAAREGDARRARAAPMKRVAVDLNVAGATTTLEGDEVGVMQLTRRLEQATRGY